MQCWNCSGPPCAWTQPSGGQQHIWSKWDDWWCAEEILPWRMRVTAGFSASLYLLSLWGSHGGSRGIFIPPECKCPAFCLTITEVRVEWVVVVSAQRMSPTVLQPGPFFRISGLDFNTNPETKTPVTFFFMSDNVIYLHVIWFIQLIPSRYGEWVWNADAPTVQIHVCN